MEALGRPRGRPDGDPGAVFAHDREVPGQRDEAPEMLFGGPNRQRATAARDGIEVQRYADRAGHRPPSATEREAITGDGGQISPATRGELGETDDHRSVGARDRARS